MAEFKNKEEYEKWKAQKLKEAKEKTSEKPQEPTKIEMPSEKINPPLEEITKVHDTVLTKKCKYCAMMIPEEAYICPYCRKKQKEHMSQKQIAGLIGSFLLILGIFLPILSMPTTPFSSVATNITLIQNGFGDGLIILLLVSIAITFIFKKIFIGLWLVWTATSLLLGYKFVQLLGVVAQFEREFEQNTILRNAMQSVQLQWGWGILFIGITLIFISLIMKEKIPIVKKG